MQNKESEFHFSNDNDQQPDALSNFLRQYGPEILTDRDTGMVKIHKHRDEENNLDCSTEDPSSKMNPADIIMALNDLTAQLKEYNLLMKKPLVPELMISEDVMKYLHITERTLVTWRQNGILRFTYIRNKFYYLKEDVEKLLRKNYNGIERDKS